VQALWQSSPVSRRVPGFSIFISGRDSWRRSREFQGPLTA
jgi:hypothetical protein